MLRVTLCLALFTTAACATSTEAMVADFCAANCAKVVQCPFSQGLTEETCNASCNDADALGACDVTQTQMDRCLTAVEAATCDELQQGTLPECDIGCDNGTDPTGVDTDAGNPGTNPTGDCALLADCCDGVTGPVKQACDTVLSAGVAVGCKVTLDAYIDEGHCAE